MTVLPAVAQAFDLVQFPCGYQDIVIKTNKLRKNHWEFKATYNDQSKTFRYDDLSRCASKLKVSQGSNAATHEVPVKFPTPDDVRTFLLYGNGKGAAKLSSKERKNFKYGGSTVFKFGYIQKIDYAVKMCHLWDGFTNELSAGNHVAFWNCLNG